MALPFFTIGHPTRQIGEFIDLLTASQVGLVVDVRTIPRSRTNPQYNREALPELLSGSQIAYEHIAELGGRRPRVRDIPPNVKKTRVFTTTPTMRWAAAFVPASPGCRNWLLGNGPGRGHARSRADAALWLPCAPAEC